jgi:hypothetical protein
VHPKEQKLAATLHTSRALGHLPWQNAKQVLPLLCRDGARKMLKLPHSHVLAVDMQSAYHSAASRVNPGNGVFAEHFQGQVLWNKGSSKVALIIAATRHSLGLSSLFQQPK